MADDNLEISENLHRVNLRLELYQKKAHEAASPKDRADALLVVEGLEQILETYKQKILKVQSQNDWSEICYLIKRDTDEKFSIAVKIAVGVFTFYPSNPLMYIRKLQEESFLKSVSGVEGYC